MSVTAHLPSMMPSHARTRLSSLRLDHHTIDAEDADGFAAITSHSRHHNMMLRRLRPRTERRMLLYSARKLGGRARRSHLVELCGGAMAQRQR